MKGGKAKINMVRDMPSDKACCSGPKWILNNELHMFAIASNASNMNNNLS